MIWGCRAICWRPMLLPRQLQSESGNGFLEHGDGLSVRVEDVAVKPTCDRDRAHVHLPAAFRKTKAASRQILDIPRSLETFSAPLCWPDLPSADIGLPPVDVREGNSKLTG